MLQEELNRVSVTSFSCLVNRIYLVHGPMKTAIIYSPFVSLRIMQLDDQILMSILHYSGWRLTRFYSLSLSLSALNVVDRRLLDE